jgi:hypothetical protein
MTKNPGTSADRNARTISGSYDRSGSLGINQNHLFKCFCRLLLTGQRAPYEPIAKVFGSPQKNLSIRLKKRIATGLGLLSGKRQRTGIS